MTKTVALKSGTAMPVMGFGTSRLTGSVGIESVKAALEVGYRHIDTADSYGNHEAVAKGVKLSGVPREEIFITTKIDGGDHAYNNVLSAAERYLEELNIDYIDLLLIHWPNRAVPVEDTLKAMQELKDAEKIRAIGVSNFTAHHLEDTLQTGVEVTVNQVETHPAFNQKDLREFCAEHNIVITAYAPLGRGADLELPLLLELANKYGATAPQIILNWVISRGMVAIPRSKNPERIKENFDSLDLTIEEADLLRIDALPQGKRIFSGGEFDY